MTEESKIGCGCMTMIILIIGVYMLIHKWCPSLDFMQMTGFAWVPILLIIAGVHTFFEEKVPTTKSKKQIEEEARREEEKERENREANRQMRERERQEALKPHVDELKRKYYREKEDWESCPRKERMAQERESAERKKMEEAERKRQEQNARDELNRRRQAEAMAEKNRREERFLRYLFSMLAKLAKADGQVDASEVKMAEKVFDRFDFAARRRKFCTGIFNEAKDNSRSIYWYAEQFGSQVEDAAVCNFVYELLWDVACADGWFHPAEKEILQTICTYLRIPESYYRINYRRRLGTFTEGDKKDDRRKAGSSERTRRHRDWSKPYVSGRSSILEAYEILECEQSATNDVLKSAYRKVAKRYHPDMLRANGVPEEMIAEATERMSQVNAAWEDIRRSRGI